ncbi:GFA family protein [Saccharospirillum impatiens]|uniref:GFA family protein n=1 Tax=Saccharospirillum impatiens TaxID=169438 RepID=UPI000412990B|nr:GFA family protein [Saccharospirillum impatiens]
MYKGQCLCGKVSINVKGPIDSIIHCHCSKCRKSSGTAYATNGFIQTADLEITSGEEQIAHFETSPGKRRHFCTVCASPVYSSNDLAPEQLRLRLGILDTDIVERPSSHIFVSSRANWDRFDESLSMYDGHEPGRNKAKV